VLTFLTFSELITVKKAISKAKLYCTQLVQYFILYCTVLYCTVHFVQKTKVEKEKAK
jgi:hypothetical protein